ncbi:tetratricopeptide repeat protein [Hyphobacterium sp.]|uniref:tetratricopeptide repeat protein n=1 Tax=Hyphobacterium sp. TaxID=2004662 RepID=UPI003BAC0D90
MRQRLLSLGIAAVLCGPGFADIRDVRDLSAPGQPAVFVGFDRAPDFREMELSGQELTLYMDAPTGPARRIEPVPNDVVSSVAAEMTEMGYRIRIGLTGPASEIEITPTQTGLLLTWQAGALNPAMPESDPAEPVIAATTPAQPARSQAGASDTETAPVPAALVTANSAAGGECSRAAQAVEADPWDLEALTAHGGCLLENGSADQAIIHLERVVAFEPGRFSAVMALAQAREQLGETTAAIALYEQAASIAATDGEAVAARARARRLTN